MSGMLLAVKAWAQTGAEWTIDTIAGTGKRGYSEDNGPAVSAQLTFPDGVAVDGAGNLYIATDSRIRKVDVATGTITTVAGTGERGYSGDNGPAVSAQLASPHGIAVDGSGNLYIADTSNHRVGILTRSLPSTTFSPPGGLRATAVSTSRTDLTWQDNSTNETGFRVQRRREGSTAWVQITTTAANATTFSDTGLEPDTTYHYLVRAFNNTGASAFSNQAIATTPGTTPPTGSGTRSRLFVPIVLRSWDRAGSFFTSEMTLTNRGSRKAAIRYTYTAAIGSGSGTATDSLGAGQQRVIPDAIDYLTYLGVPIGEGAAGGMLRVDFSDRSSASDAAVTVRVSTPVGEGQGRAGLAYPGLSPTHRLTGPVWLAGLRQNAMDRSNVAVRNAGEASEGDVTLQVTVFSGDPEATRGSTLPDILPPRSVRLPEVTLSPGGFHQYSGLLFQIVGGFERGSFENGYVKVERVSGTAPYYAYGVINDQANSDGSFVFPVTESSLVGVTGQTLPVIVETGTFNSELTVTNFSVSAKRVDFSFVADAIQTDDDTVIFSLRLELGEQSIIPHIVNELRQQGVAEMGPAGQTFAGAVFATVESGDMSGIVIGVRTGSAGGSTVFSTMRPPMAQPSATAPGSTDSSRMRRIGAIWLWSTPEKSMAARVSSTWTFTTATAVCWSTPWVV